MAIDTQESSWTLKRLLEWTSEFLGKAGVDQARLCAEIMLAETLGCQRIELYTNFDSCPTAEELSKYRGWVRRCSQHEPVAYLVGKAHFYSLEFKVEPGVLVPRPETELLVTEGLTFLRGTTRPTVDVLDVCTGSGCVAVALAGNVVEAEVVAVDNSADALAIAKQNIEAHDLEARIVACESDLFGGVEQSGKALFDLIVSNPPYVSAGEFEKLDANVREYEPREALVGGEDGLDVVRRIVGEAEPYLADCGMLMLEVGYDQAGEVGRLFEKAGYLTDVSTVRDHQGHERVVMGRRE